MSKTAGQMLSDAERAEIDGERAHYPDAQAVSIEALRIVQAHRGWVSDEALAALSDHLGLSTADLEGVATFYNQIYRHPVGRNVIQVCDSVSCFVMGCERVRAGLEQKLGIQPGQTTPDDRFTLLPVVCLGACDHAPVMLINQDLHADVDPDKLDPLLDAYS